MAIINGTDGNDSLSGTSGADTLAGGNGSDTVSGGAGDDIFIATSPTVTADTLDAIDGGAGYDRLVAVANGAGITFGSLTNLEEISANGFSSVGIWGGDGVETWNLSGLVLTGISYLDAGNGNDSIITGAANDTFKCYVGDDTISSGAGDDVFWYTGTNNGADALDGGSGNDRAKPGLGCLGERVAGAAAARGVLHEHALLDQIIDVA